jgi:hypothetical protein
MLGLVLVAIGFVALWLGLREDDYRRLVPGLIIGGIGFGLVIAPVGAEVLEAAPARERGVAAAFAILFRLLGMTIGISALTAVGVRRLQSLTSRIEPVVQRSGESTAEFLVRQSQYIEEYAIPLSLKVVRETFLIGAGLSLLALLPIVMLRRYGSTGQEKRSHRSATAAGRAEG